VSLSCHLGNDWTPPAVEEKTTLRQYSTTGDILSYRRCRRQYGIFSIRGFVSATATQRYFGTLVHDVMDTVHRGWQSDGELPDEEGVRELVEQAHDRLWRAGVRAYGARQQKQTATTLVHRFILALGSVFFRHIQEAEYRLQRALKTTKGDREYILDGIVDVLAGAVLNELGHQDQDSRPDDVEIWDYKSGKAPDRNHRFNDDYEYQMLVYAELYKRQQGTYPARCVLVHLGEFGDAKNWKEFTRGRSLTEAFPRLIQVVALGRPRIHRAMEIFHDTVDKIETERERAFSDQWLAPTRAEAPDKDTCDACELRYKCSAYPAGRRQAKQPL
jgi:DNA helicase II / ATP-dependent DNA helicase PcrA